MNKHVVLISPHSSMIDCVNFHKIKYTIIDKKENQLNYNNLKYNSLFILDYSNTNLLFNVLDGINKSSPIDAVVTLTEDALMLAAQCSEYLHLKSTPTKIVNLISDKLEMRKILSFFKEYSIKFIKLGSKEDLKKITKYIKYPFIVKPRYGVGSKDVYKINKISDLKNIDFSINLIAEEYIPGKEYSVEFFSFNGKHKLIAVTEKLLFGKNNFTEIGHCIPSDISVFLKNRIKNYVSKFLNIIGVKNGPSHTEIKIKNNKIFIIETHNRIGGDRISSLIKLSTGIDLVEMSILWPLNMCNPITKKVKYHFSAIIKYFNPNTGKLISIDGYDKVKYSPGVIDIEFNCKIGDTINPITNSFDRVGFVIVMAKSLKQARKRVQAAISKINFNVIS